MSSKPSRRIVVGVDESDASVDALRWAVADAVRNPAVLDIVGVWDVEPINLGIEQAIITSPHGQPVERLARLDQVIEWIRPERDGVEFTIEVLAGDTGAVLAERAEGADLLVLGRPQRVGMPFGSHAVNHVLKHATCPIVLVPSRAQVLADTDR
jgi:nucleotide-binding universal stress UspA family protein